MGHFPREIRPLFPGEVAGPPAEIQDHERVLGETADGRPAPRTIGSASFHVHIVRQVRRDADRILRMGDQDCALLRPVRFRLLGHAHRALQFPTIRRIARPGIRGTVQFQVMHAAFPGDFLPGQENGLPEQAGLIVFHPEDAAFRRGKEDGARETGHFQVIEIRMIGGIGRFGDHRGNKSVADALLERFDVKLPDGGGGADVGHKVRTVFGERRLPVGVEWNLGEGNVAETDGPGVIRVQEGAQRDGSSIRPRGGAGKEVVGRQVAVERHLCGGDAAVLDGVRSAGVRSHFLAARGGEQEDGRNQEFCCSAHNLGFMVNKSAPRTLRGGVTKNPEKTRGRALSRRRAPAAQIHRVQMGAPVTKASTLRPAPFAV